MHMQQRDKTIISTATLVASLLAYWYAKATARDAAPYVMIGGFTGTIIGELLAERFNNQQQ